jgi:hypothetical protein
MRAILGNAFIAIKEYQMKVASDQRVSAIIEIPGSNEQSYRNLR